MALGGCRRCLCHFRVLYNEKCGGGQRGAPSGAPQRLVRPAHSMLYVRVRLAYGGDRLCVRAADTLAPARGLTPRVDPRPPLLLHGLGTAHRGHVHGRPVGKAELGRLVDLRPQGDLGAAHMGSLRHLLSYRGKGLRQMARRHHGAVFPAAPDVLVGSQSAAFRRLSAHILKVVIFRELSEEPEYAVQRVGGAARVELDAGGAGRIVLQDETVPLHYVEKMACCGGSGVDDRDAGAGDALDDRTQERIMGASEDYDVGSGVQKRPYARADG